jgi:tetratricopeptide (TPR) repeat protein
MKAVVTFAFLLVATVTVGQLLNIDSLKVKLSTASQDSVRLKLLGTLARYYADKPDSALYYATQIISFSQQSDNKFYEALGFAEMGNALGHSGNYPKALEMELKSLKIAEQLKNGREERMAFAYIQIGLLDKAYGRFENAIANFQKYIRVLKDQGVPEATLQGAFSLIG